MADDYTIAHEPVLSLDLMERAALGLSGYIGQQTWEYQTIRIFAGFGNNGGDGIALARLLSGSGKKIYLYVIRSEKDWSPDTKANLDRLPESENLVVHHLQPGSGLPGIVKEDLVIDALFGSGLTREPAGFMAELIDHINLSMTRVISVDMPSGLFGEDNRLNSKQHVIRAFQTLTFEFPKLCFFFPENQAYVGEWIVIPIGLHPDFIRDVQTPWNFIGFKDAASWLKNRNKFSHKGIFGHSLLVCGSTGKTGAAVLSSTACIRSGSGLTTVALPSSGIVVVQTAVPEAMTLPDSDADHWTCLPDLSPYTAIGAGPGIGTHPDTWKALEKLLKESQIPLVLDADALNLLSQYPGSLKLLIKNCILTPHPGEFRRLFGDDPDDYTRLMRLKDLSELLGLVIVLKGANTAVAGPDGKVWFNITGNPGMATGGSGDVLTGIITGLVAQGYEPFTAARLGVFLHGLAGDLASESTGFEALTASDINGSIGKAFLRLHHIIIPHCA